MPRDLKTAENEPWESCNKINKSHISLLEFVEVLFLSVLPSITHSRHSDCQFKFYFYLTGIMLPLPS